MAMNDEYDAMIRADINLLFYLDYLKKSREISVFPGNHAFFPDSLNDTNLFILLSSVPAGRLAKEGISS